MTAIFEAEPQHAPAIAQMARDLVEHGLSWTWREDRVLRALHHDEVLGCVALSSTGEVIGFALAQYQLYDAHLLLIAVLPEARRKGLAGRLLAWHEAVARAAGIKRMHVEVRAGNQSAIAFYEAIGFGRPRRISGYYEGREDALRLTWHLGG